MTRYAKKDRNPLDGAGVYRSLPQMFGVYGWKLGTDGLWWQEGGVQGCTTAQVMEFEDIMEVQPFKIGTTGKVSVSYETQVWAPSLEAAQAAANDLPETTTVGDMTFEMPDAADFDGWSLAVSQTSDSGETNP